MSNDLNLPWKIGHMETHQASIQDATGLTRIGWLTPAVAEHIVRCVNNHDALVAALETVLANSPEPYCAITRAVDRQVREALAAARGEL